MPPKQQRAVSDRAEEVKRRALLTTMRHTSDVRGAMGCYYCWIGDYARCEKHCKLVHRTTNDNQMQGANPFDAATPYLTAVHSQEKSLFNEIVGSASSRVSQAADKVYHDEIMYTANGGGLLSEHLPGRQSNSSAMALYDRRPTAALRHPELVSHRQPLESSTPFSNRHGAYNIRATPHTTIAVTPTRYSFSERHKDFLADDTAIWGGTLARASTTAHDARSRELGRRMNMMAKANIPTASRKHYDSAASSFLKVRKEPVLDGIVQGHFRHAMELPLPSVFEEVL